MQFTIPISDVVYDVDYEVVLCSLWRSLRSSLDV